MVQRDMRVKSEFCPDCGGELVTERDLLLCKDHGAFFVYGPRLIVRAPQPAAKATGALLPWEARRVKLA